MHGFTQLNNLPSKLRPLMKSHSMGFTIIEMMVIIGVLSVLSGLLILYSRTGEITSALLRESAKLSVNIGRAKNMAITNALWQGQRVCGYGVYFDEANDQYIIFTEIANNCEAASHLRPADGSLDVETIIISDPLEISKSDITQVFFLPPDPTVYFEPTALNEVQIEIKAPNDASMGITINTTGQVTTF